MAARARPASLLEGYDPIVIPEASFLFSIAGLNASLGGLSGLVAGLRRGTDMRPMACFGCGALMTP